MSGLTLEDEILRKAVEQIGSLLSSYEAGMISAEAFRLSIETIWAVLGGVVRTDDFKALMEDANAEVRELPHEPRIRVLNNGTSQLVLMRTSETVRAIVSTAPRVRTKGFDLPDEAVAYFNRLAEDASQKGYGEIAL